MIGKWWGLMMMSRFRLLTAPPTTERDLSSAISVCAGDTGGLLLTTSVRLGKPLLGSIWIIALAR